MTAEASPPEASLEATLDAVLARFLQNAEHAQTDAELYALQVAFLGRKGELTLLRARMGELPADARKGFGQAFNRVKSAVEAGLAARGSALRDAAAARDLARRDDLSALTVDAQRVGSLHVITQTRRALEQVFVAMGFDVLDGPHVEHERYNFDDLNFQADHPARDMQDTFFVDSRDGAPLLLRTHTSPVQVRALLSRSLPLRVVVPGTVFRRDDDATHSPMFHQIEGLCVDEGVGMADLKATLYRFVRAFFGAELGVRFRPSYFPFVEPGAEFDMQCPFCGGGGCGVCKGSGFIELGGAGMVHPNVLRAAGIDAERYTGWAFGFGIDRMAMLRYQIHDLRLMFEGDVRFLEQFPC